MLAATLSHLAAKPLIVKLIGYLLREDKEVFERFKLKKIPDPSGN